MGPDRRAIARVRKPTRWTAWPEDAWIPVDRGFWCQPPEAILETLLRRGPDPVATPDEALKVWRTFPPGEFADNRASRSPRPLILRRVLEMYSFATDAYEGIRAAWKAQLPRGRKRRSREARAAEPALREALHGAFPKMTESQLKALVDGTVRSESSEVREALRAYVGQTLSWSGSRVRHAVTRAGHLGPHGLDADAEEGLERFLRWIDEARSELRDDVAAGIEGILIARELAAPCAEFYTEAAPLYLDMARVFRRLKPDPRQQLGVAAVEAFGRGDEKAAMELWNSRPTDLA